MGFGTLFIGYFLMLNITYFTFTDIIAALVMLYGLYKLASVSPYFVRPMWAAAGFSAFALFELGFGIYDLFSSAELSEAITYIGMTRALVVAIYTAMMLEGLHGISHKLEVGKVPRKSRRMILVSFTVYCLYIALSTPFITSLVPTAVSSVLYLITLIGVIATVIVNLTLIYTCYMYICMPKDLEPKKDTPSRFGFVNEYRRRKAEHEAEMARDAERKRQEKAARRRKK